MSLTDYLSNRSTVEAENGRTILRYVQENKQQADGDGGWRPMLANNISPENALRMGI